jgi:hypothetical protein
LLLLQIKQILEVHTYTCLETNEPSVKKKKKKTNLVVVGTVVSESTIKMSWLNFQLSDKNYSAPKELKKHFGIYIYIYKQE